jgi:hypothetical protein
MILPKHASCVSNPARLVPALIPASATPVEMATTLPPQFLPSHAICALMDAPSAPVPLPAVNATQIIITWTELPARDATLYAATLAAQPQVLPAKAAKEDTTRTQHASLVMLPAVTVRELVLINACPARTEPDHQLQITQHIALQVHVVLHALPLAIVIEIAGVLLINAMIHANPDMDLLAILERSKLQPPAV